MYDSGMSDVTVTEARATLPEILDRVGEGDEVTITRHGRPVAVVVRPDTLRARRAASALRRADDIAALLERVATTAPERIAGLPPGRADELVAGLRDERTRASST